MILGAIDASLSALLTSSAIMFDAFTPSRAQTLPVLQVLGSRFSPELVHALQPAAHSPGISAKARRMRVHHRIAGRLRVSIPVLRGDPALTQRLVDALEANADIRSVRANPTCGSLIIRHRLDAMSTDQLEAYVSSLIEPWLVGQDHQRPVHQGPVPADTQGRSQRCSPVGTQGSMHGSDQRSAQWLATVPSSRRQETERGRQRSTLIRQPLTWPLADLSRDRTEKNRGALAQVSKAGPSKTKPTAVSGIDRALFSVPERCWLCDLNQYLMRAMLKFSLRCWWRDRRRALTRRFAALQTIRLEHLSRRLRS